MPTRSVSKELLGTRSAQYLPAYTARALYRHLTIGWKMTNPRVGLYLDPSSAPSRKLMIARQMSDFPDRMTAARQCHALLWYLSPQRAVALQPESMAASELRPLSALFFWPLADGARHE